MIKTPRQIIAVLLVSLSSIVASTTQAAKPAPTPGVLRPADDDARALVRQALQAEIAGENERRAGYLRDALTADEDHSAAHWHSGHVQLSDGWYPFGEAAAQTQRAGKVAEYRRLRNSGQNTAEAHLELARWCATAGLTGEERLHLLAALQLGLPKKQQAAAMNKLGLVRRGGQLLPAAQVAAMKEEARRRAAVMEQWKPRLAAMRRDLDAREGARRQAAIEQLRAYRDPAIVPALEATFAKSKPDVVHALIESLAATPGQAATDSLIRFAVRADDETIRRSAAEGLKSRPLFSYVPTLLAALQSPVEVQFQTSVFNGQFRHHLTLYQEGPMIDRLFSSAGGSREDWTFTTHPIDHQPTDTDVIRTPDTTADSDAAQAQMQLSANLVREKVNERLMTALEISTGNDQNGSPNRWWTWWFDENETYQPPQRPVSQLTRDYVPNPVNVHIRSISCFPAGTPIETSTGPLAIEQVRPGDCVLAQDAETGELAYKPVIATTVRPPSPLIEITAGDETIRATRGHPFWVSGIGWRMAKELKAGQQLHTTSGSVAIETAEPNGEAECHNLIVADFNSYFVGKNRFLVHDNNLRQVTTATVPGLTQE